MPTISSFYGIFILMHMGDHAPPHFHARYAEYEIMINIKNLSVMEGKLPRRALNLVLDWAELHQSELLSAWHLCERRQTPGKIPPLE